jgi:hypothetical protein
MVENNNKKVSEEFVIQVFDKVKEVNEALAIDVTELRNAVTLFGEAFNKRYEGQPRPAELHALLNSWGKTFEIRHTATKEKLEYLEGIISSSESLLKEHCDHAEKGICNLEESLEKDDSKLDKILNAIDSVKSRIHVMIVAVLVALALFTVAYFFVSHSVDKVIATKLESVEKKYQEDLQHQLDEINKALRKHMRETGE